MSKTEMKRQLRDIKKFYKGMIKPHTAEKHKIFLGKRVEALTMALKNLQ